MRLHSGIATMSKEIVLHTSHKYDWIQVGAAVKHPDEGKFFDVSDSVNKEAGIDNASVKIIPQSGYGNQQLIRNLMISEDIDAILHFTDPRFWDWLYAMEDESVNIFLLCTITFGMIYLTHNGTHHFMEVVIY